MVFPQRRDGAAMSVTIRPARPDEALAVARAHVRADFETYQPIFREQTVRRDLGAMRLRWSEALAAGDDLLVAEAEGKVVGFAHVRGDWLSALYLIGRYRRRGIGRRLIAELRARARARGIERLRLNVVAANAPAIAFYEAHGGRAIGREIIHEGDRAWEDLVFELPTLLPRRMLKTRDYGSS